MPITDNKPDPLVLTIDVGSSSLRTNLFTHKALRIPEHETQLHYTVNTTPDGGVEIDPYALRDSVFRAIDATLEHAGQAKHGISGVAGCSLVSNVMGVTASGKPTTPIYTWADTRCAKEAAELRSALNVEAVHNRTGCTIHTSYLPARLLWLKRTLPEAYARTDMWITIGDWLQMALFGKPLQSISVAAWSGLLNRHTLDWDTDLLNYIDVSEDHLPALATDKGAMRGITGEHAERWPALRDVPWFPFEGDGYTGNLGSGAYTSGDLAMQIGTSGAIRALVQDSGVTEVPRGLWCYRVSAESSLLGGALSEGGNLLDWLAGIMRVSKRADLKRLETEAAALPPDSHGLTVLPFLAGERSPGWHGGARATISGLSLSTTQAEIARAAQEAIAYRFKAVLDLIEPALPPTGKIIASGGALLNTKGWMQVMADVFGQAVTASGEQQASSRGAALIGLRSLGVIGDFTQLPAVLGATYQPHLDRQAAYNAAIQRQKGLYEKLVATALPETSEA